MCDKINFGLLSKPLLIYKLHQSIQKVLFDLVVDQRLIHFLHETRLRLFGSTLSAQGSLENWIVARKFSNDCITINFVCIKLWS